MRPILRTLLTIAATLPFFATAQPLICNRADSILQDWQSRLHKINTVDPELIPLHYFFVKDIQSEMRSFERNDLNKLRDCPDINYQQTAHRYDDLSFKAKNLSEQLKYQKEHVDEIFYRKADEAILFGKIDSAYYFLDKALQYNHLQADALIAKAKLLINESQYDECIDIVHKLYNEVTLTREQEMAVSDYTLMLYEVLYHTGDSLLNAGREAEALDIFTSLETFCKNMPSTYCNDDYYKAIMKSKSGVYKSFLKIAEVARQRGNKEIEANFLRYAEEYRMENEISEESESESETELIQQQVVTDTEERQDEEIIKIEPVETKPDTNTGKITVTPQPDCQTLIMQGVEALAKGERKAAADIFKQALQIGGCDTISIEEILKLIEE